MTMTDADDRQELTDEERRALAEQIWRSRPDIGGAELAREVGWKPRTGTKWARIFADRYGTPPGPRPAAPRADSTPAQDGPARPAAPFRTAPAATSTPARPTGKRHAARPSPTAPSPWLRRITVAGVFVVAVVAAGASYSHMHHLAAQAGESDLTARVLPLSVDGLVLVASMSLLAAKRAQRAAGALSWLALLLGLGASLAANVAAAEPTLVGRLVAAWPPVALALSFELLLRQTRDAR